MKNFIITSLVFLLVLSAIAKAETDWFPYPVEIWDVPFEMSSTRTPADYIPLSNTKTNWNICVSFPHMKDTYWLAVNFGISQEIRRFGCTMQLYQAGGYGNLESQIQQIRQCVQEGADGVIAASISYDGLNELVTELKKKKIPVIDVINGISSSDVSAKSLVSFKEMGQKTGEYLVGMHPNEKNGSVKIAWFPGPKGAGWVTAGNNGFLESLQGSNLQIVTTRYGDTGLSVQSELIRDVLNEYANELDYIVGTGVTAEAAIKILRKRGLSKRIKIISYYLTPAVYRNLQRGKIIASSTDSAVIQGRIAVDQLVRILDNQPYDKHVAPILHVIDGDNIKGFDRKTMLAPHGFQATYTVNRQIPSQ